MSTAPAVLSAYGWPTHPVADIFPMLGPDELHELAEDIRANGLHEPLWLWEDPERGTALLDGRNRAAACELAGVEPATRLYTGADPLGFVVSENIKRRHLNAGQRAFLGAEVEKRYAEDAAKRVGGRPRADAKPPADRREVSDDRKARESAEKAAKATGASGRSISRAKRVEEKAPDLAEQVKAGDLALDRAERIVRDREAEERRIEQARRETAVSAAPPPDVRAGDFRQVLADLRDVDAIITDPPYAAEYLPLLEDLAVWADSVLSPDGVLAVLMGQTYLPDVYRLLGGGRPYRWTACYLTLGPGYASHARRVHSQWKPVLIYGGGPRIADVLRSEGTDASAKALHHWGQDYAGFHAVVERLTERGQVVVDPFMGSGTTLLAAHALGRHAIGCDVDHEAVATARRRLLGEAA